MDTIKSVIQDWIAMPYKYGASTIFIDMLAAVLLVVVFKLLIRLISSMFNKKKHGSIIRHCEAIPVKMILVNRLSRIEHKYQGKGEYGIDVVCEDGDIKSTHYNIDIPKHIYDVMSAGQLIVIETMTTKSFDEEENVIEPTTVTQIISLISEEGKNHIDEIKEKYDVDVERVKNVAIIK